MVNSAFRPFIVFSIPVLILLILAFPPFLTTMMGDEIKIKTTPVDPTDLFRGSYVALNYEIETVQPSQLADSIKAEFKTTNMGDYKKVYVRLKQNGNGLYAVNSVTKEKPSEGMYLKGELEVPYELKNAKTVHIRYGLDNYFASEEKAKEMESNALTSPSMAVIKVRNGHVVLTDIIIE
ncbi:GDYXXLXY domain-containing protein [Peribacillus muralis]|uniref:GDYXXLXY domain-containing protein n=1 Tax=Peribacillus muralis TaxID=264697 RepID=UPI001F4EDB25|nr:GDYXXLXY domain-containing protein [Peribacillus muralis]MCK1993919.1 GDYXXLXY domain-containing protein [Peribacillus muralis]MCK2014474.1 GDYXXLXY domain-containing protein [Peribacillus muralis]